MDAYLLLAESLTGPQTILLGLALLVVAFVMRRSAVLNRRSRTGDRVAEIPREALSAEQALLARLHELEVRLHDQTRETEARAATRIAQLNQLVMEAERAIARLEELGRQNVGGAARGSCESAEIRSTSDILCNEALDISERMIVAYLLQSGYTAEEVARLIDRAGADTPVAETRGDLPPIADAA